MKEYKKIQKNFNEKIFNYNIGIEAKGTNFPDKVCGTLKKQPSRKILLRIRQEKVGW